MAGDFLTIAPEVADALAEGRPVVALESTLIAHGLPYPRNLETAQAAEAAVRAGGAVPATIGIRAGKLMVGLGADDLAHFAQNGAPAGNGGRTGTGHEIAKVSRADLGYVLARGADGATTVAATMVAAHAAGIRVFATGGIGGVHRGAADSFDVSADLTELSRTPVAVVASGAKVILDLPKTLEALETLGVPVIGYGTDRFPAFYSRDSGLDLTLRANDAAEVAGILKAHWGLGLQSGVLIANPPPEEFALPHDEVEGWVERALAEAARDGVSGKDVTPYLLQRISALSEGRSLEANVGLIVRNASAATEIVGEMHQYGH